MATSKRDNTATTSDNQDTFVDCLTIAVAHRLGVGDASTTGGRRRKRGGKGRKNEIKPVVRPEDRGDSDAADLRDFIEYLADEIFSSLPEEIRSLSYAAVQDDRELDAKYARPLEDAVMEEVVRALPPSVPDSLCSYALVTAPADVDRFLEPIISAYVAAVTTPASEYTPELSASRPNGCEICEREQLPLTYHHLIPRQVHDKVVRRGWHSEWELNKVAWLCRACHSYVHKIASNEELARELYSVDLLMEREDMRKWASWVGRVRWKAR